MNIRMISRSVPIASVAKGAAFAALALGLASCGGGGGGGHTTPPMMTSVIDFFGTAFAADFRASSTSTPPVPMSGDIIPVSLTTAPQSLS